MRAERMHRVLAEAGCERPLEDVRLGCEEIWAWLESTYWNRHIDPGFEAQIAWLGERFGVPTDERQLIEGLRAAFVEPIFDVPPKPDPAALPVLRRMHELGLKVGLICNTSITPGTALRHLLATWGLEPLLPVQLYSCELGIRKPAPRIFHEAARRLEVDIAAMLHVGDQPVNDVQGALSAGAGAIQVGRETTLERASDIIAAKLNI